MSDEQEDSGLEALLEYLKQNRGFDFTGYKHSSLTRRIRSRMQRVGVERFSDYIDFLEVHPGEFSYLFDTILINVTGFFRDPAAWEYLAAEIIPQILRTKEAIDLIRIWSAGCASGEEPYSAAMLFAEALGVPAVCERMKIYGTDVDEEALNEARHATYTAKQLEEVAPALREKYFEANGDRFVFHSELRRAVIFGRHDLLQDAPISRLDLLICRNVLMYFNAETQTRILDRFCFALRDGGFLFLGKAEMLLGRSRPFVAVDLKQRFFSKRGRSGLRERAWSTLPVLEAPSGSPLLDQLRFREIAFDLAPIPQIVVDAKGLLVLANLQVRAHFGLSAPDLSRPFQDVELSYRPTELRSWIQRCSPSTAR